MSAQYHSRRIIADALILVYTAIEAARDGLYTFAEKTGTWIDRADKAAIQAAADAKQALIEKHTDTLGKAGDLHEAALRQARRLEDAAKALRETAHDEFNTAIDTFGAAIDKAHEFLHDAIEYHQ